MVKDGNNFRARDRRWLWTNIMFCNRPQNIQKYHEMWHSERMRNNANFDILRDSIRGLNSPCRRETLRNWDFQHQPWQSHASWQETDARMWVSGKRYSDRDCTNQILEMTLNRWLSTQWIYSMTTSEQKPTRVSWTRTSTLHDTAIQPICIKFMVILYDIVKLYRRL